MLTNIEFTTDLCLDVEVTVSIKPTLSGRGLLIDVITVTIGSKDIDITEIIDDDTKDELIQEAYEKIAVSMENYIDGE